MLELARRKPHDPHAAPFEFVQAPADDLPSADSGFHVVVVFSREQVGKQATLTTEQLAQNDAEPS